MSGIRVTYSGLISFVTGLVSIFTGLIFMLILTRNLSPQEFGTWNLISGLLFYGMILDPIISYWATRETARNIKSGKTAVLANGMFSIGGIFVYIISIYFVGPQSQVPQDVLFFAIILIPAMYLRKLLDSINLGWRPQLISYAQLSFEIIKIPMALVFLYFLDMSVTGVILIFLIAYLTSIIIEIIYARSKIKNEIKKEFLEKWLRTFWLTIYPRVGTLLYRSDVIIFSVITGSTIGLAYYTAATVIASLVGYTVGISSSMYGKLLEGDNKVHLKENVTRLLYFAIPLTAISITFARGGLFALNPVYEVAILAVIFITIRTLFATLNITFSSFLTGIEEVDQDTESTFKDYIKSKLFFIPTLKLIQYTLYVCILTVALLLLEQNSSQLDLIIFWSIIALAIEFPFTIYLYISTRRTFSFTLDFGSISKYLLISIGVFGIIYVLEEKFLDYTSNIFEFLPRLLFFVVLGIGSYLVITYFVDLRTRKLFESIIHELKNKIP